MKSGDLVRFKDHHYRESYGVGVLLGQHQNGTVELHWAFFAGERIMVREKEVEVINEGR